MSPGKYQRPVNEVRRVLPVQIRYQGCGGHWRRATARPWLFALTIVRSTCCSGDLLDQVLEVDTLVRSQLDHSWSSIGVPAIRVMTSHPSGAGGDGESGRCTTMPSTTVHFQEGAQRRFSSVCSSSSIAACRRSARPRCPLRKQLDFLVRNDVADFCAWSRWLKARPIICPRRGGSTAVARIGSIDLDAQPGDGELYGANSMREMMPLVMDKALPRSEAVGEHGILDVRQGSRT